MLTQPQHGGKTLEKAVIRRKQKRNPRKIIEATALDWARWTAAAKAEGVNFSEFTRRALNYRAESR